MIHFLFVMDDNTKRVIRWICIGCFGLVILALIVGTVVSFLPATIDRTITELPTTIQTGDLTVTEKHIESDSRFKHIVGTVKNNGNKKYSLITIQFNLYDAKGVLLGNAQSAAEDIDPNGQWKFSTPILLNNVSNVASYKLTELIGYL